MNNIATRVIADRWNTREWEIRKGEGKKKIASPTITMMYMLSDSHYFVI